MDGRTTTAWRWLSDLLPATLQSRLALTVLLAIIAVMSVAAGSYQLATMAALPGHAEEEATEALSLVAHELQSQMRILEAAVVLPKTSPRLRELAAASQPPDEATAGQLQELVGRSRVSALVLIDREGTLLYGIGDDTAVEDLAHFASLPVPLEVSRSGFASVGGRPSLVVMRPVSGSEPLPGTGTVLLASPIDLSGTRMSARLDSDPSTPTGRPGTVPVFDPYFGVSHVEAKGSSFEARTDLAAIDGRYVSTLIIEAPYSEGPLAASPAVTLLATLVIAVLVSTLVGLLLSRAIGSAISTFTTHMRREAEAALEGRAFSRVPETRWLPLEFRALATSFNTMLDRFETHEERLANAMQEALDAKTALDTAFTESPEGKILLSDCVIELLNPAAAMHLLTSPPVAVGLSFEEAVAHLTFMDERERPVTVGEILARAAGKGILTGVTAPDRTIRWLLVHSNSSDCTAGTALISTRDMTEERRINSLRTEIVSLVSHDLRNPLTVINGYLGILSGDPGPDVAARAIEAAQRSVSRMQDLLEDLLSVARAEEVFAPAEMVPVDMSALSDDVCASMKHLSNHDLTSDWNGLSTVLGEERRLRQALVNLINNALKHTPPDTLVTISGGGDGSSVTIEIEDEGPGVPDIDREVIFERYTRLPSGEARRGGIGLGLYIVRTIIESHGGSVCVKEGERAGGACFVVTLPSATERQD